MAKDRSRRETQRQSWFSERSQDDLERSGDACGAADYQRTGALPAAQRHYRTSADLRGSLVKGQRGAELVSATYYHVGMFSCLLAAVPADEPASQPLMKEPVGSLYQSAIKDRTATHTDHTNEARVVS